MKLSVPARLNKPMPNTERFQHPSFADEPGYLARKTMPRPDT